MPSKKAPVNIFYKNTFQILKKPLCLYFFYALSCNLLARQVEIVRDAYARPRIPIIYQSVNEYMPDKPQGSD